MKGGKSATDLRGFARIKANHWHEAPECCLPGGDIHLAEAAKDKRFVHLFQGVSSVCIRVDPWQKTASTGKRTGAAA